MAYTNRIYNIVIPMQRSSKVSKAPYIYIFLHEEDFECFMAREIDHCDYSRNNKETILHVNVDKCLEAINSKIEFMYVNQV